MRRSYSIFINVNGLQFDELMIDPHFEVKHGKVMNDDIILLFVQNLNGGTFKPVATDKDGFKYFKTEPMFYKGKPYRLVWLIDPNETYLGVVNCFRRKKVNEKKANKEKKSKTNKQKNRKRVSKS